MNPEDKAAQVSDQCRAVAHMARAIATVYADFAKIVSDGRSPDLLEMTGKRSADLMEALGDVLNGMDAVADEDDWMIPVFEKAQEMWPNDERTASDGLATLLDGCNALLGLLTLLAARDDISDELRAALTEGHRIDEAKAAISKAEGRS